MNKTHHLALGVIVVIVILGFGYAGQRAEAPQVVEEENQSESKPGAGTPQAKELETITLTGTYVCLPLKAGETSPDCAFGILADGEYYAVNFGAGAGSMADFRDGETITAKGTLILRADLNPDSWTKFTMKGLFTVLEKL